MKEWNISFNILCLAFILVSNIGNARTLDDFELPHSATLELNRIQETYNILDIVTDEIWPGWDNYRDFPFLLKFDNGLKLLIGHPSPPISYFNLNNNLIDGKHVYVDTTDYNKKDIDYPLQCGGGIIYYGPEGKKVRTLDMRLTKVDSIKERLPIEAYAESHILVYIHELFHCFTFDHIPLYYGNFLYNSDENFATYSEIEGMALYNAVIDTSESASLQFVKDFIHARKSKRKGMRPHHIAQESTNELMEGLAEYSELKTLMILPKSHRGVSRIQKDPYYNNFLNREKFYNKYLYRLKENASKSFLNGIKLYDYGAFQAILLDQFYPGWKQQFTKENYLDSLLIKRIQVPEFDSNTLDAYFNSRYDLDLIKTNHSNNVKNRNELYKSIKSRKGKIYIISFKPVDQYIIDVPDKSIPKYQLGDSYLYPEGIGTINVDDVTIDFIEEQMEIDQLYFIKVVDTVKSQGAYPIILYDKNVNNIFTNVQITTRQFKLIAPKVQLQEKGDRTKIYILSKYKHNEE